ncbi:MAG TPA: ATP-binding protein, partial [Actinomycetota bacterium]|nr:ATP-binding protein [Actinomycetota bacterium]
ERLGCAAGHAYVLDALTGRLRPTSIWFPAIPEVLRDFKSITAESDFAPGEGMHGVVYETGNPSWVEDLKSEERFIRGKSVKDLPLASAVFVPARVGDKIEGVLEFFFEERRPEDPELLGVLDRVGSQVGEIIRRQDSERVLAERLEELARSNSELEQFAYVASHDLQEPLRMITSYLQLLVEGYSQSLDEKAEKYIDYAVDGAKRMQELVQDLLTFSRVATHGKAPETVPADEALDTALHNLDQAVSETGAKIKREPLPLVQADKGQLVQVFQNLIGNALKFSGEHAPDISVSAQRNGSSCVFSIKDRGIGIAPRHAERIFTIFQRLHTKSEYPGTGIGLSICKKIIERHGGRIWVDSEPGAGAEFKFTLPVASRGS